jgi:hypothetical protein
MERRVERINSDMLDSGRGFNGLVVTLTAAAPTYQMKAVDQNIRAISSADDAAGIITLPSMAEAAGKFYYINAPTGAAGGDISLYVKETATELTTVGDLDADDDWVMLFCDGYHWRTITSGVA